MSLLGKKLRDKVTGLTGIAVGRTQWLTGCDQYGIQPEAKDGEVPAAHWFDESRFEVVGDGLAPESVKSEITGGPQLTPRKTTR